MQMKTLPASFKRFIMTLLLLGLAAALAACGGAKENEGNAAADGKIQVVSTTGMIHDLVKQVGGEHVEAFALMQPGVDPHLYKASQGDLRRLEQAELIFYNGLHLEGKMIDVFEQMAKTKPTVPVTKNIAASELLPSGDQGMEHDPHVWFNVKLWISAAETIRDELVKLDAVHADSYKTNAQSYIKQLEELDQYAKTQIASIPERQRVLVTAHDAFGYFGKAYGIQVRGLQGMNTASEYGSKDVSELRDYLVANKIKAVFVESSVPKKSIEAVTEGAKRQGHEIQIGGELFSDAMGAEGTPEGTYPGMVRHNVDTIVKALK